MAQIKEDDLKNYNLKRFDCEDPFFMEICAIKVDDAGYMVFPGPTIVNSWIDLTRSNLDSDAGKLEVVVNFASITSLSVDSMKFSRFCREIFLKLSFAFSRSIYARTYLFFVPLTRHTALRIAACSVKSFICSAL